MGEMTHRTSFFVEYFGRLNLPRGRVTEPETICFGQIGILFHMITSTGGRVIRSSDYERESSAIEKACAKQKRQLKNNLAYKAARLDLNRAHKRTLTNFNVTMLLSMNSAAIAIGNAQYVCAGRSSNRNA